MVPPPATKTGSPPAADTTSSAWALLVSTALASESANRCLTSCSRSKGFIGTITSPARMMPK